MLTKRFAIVLLCASLSLSGCRTGQPRKPSLADPNLPEMTITTNLFQSTIPSLK